MIKSGLSMLSNLDPRARFAIFYIAAVGLGMALLLAVFSHLEGEARRVRARNDETARLERIVTQTWWREERTWSDQEVGRIKQRFWSAPTIGSIRAELERVLQAKISASGLKASALVVDVKAIDSKGIKLLKSQIKITGLTHGVLALIESLGDEPRDIFVAGVSLRILAQQSQAELTVVVPTIELQKESSSDRGVTR